MFNENEIEKLNVSQLIEFRDKSIDDNVKLLKNFGASEQELIDRKEEVLKSEWGLVSFVDKNYNNLTEKEKLIKQIRLVEYLNSKEDIMYPAGIYFECSNEIYQIDQYLIKKGKDPAYFNSYEGLKFLIDNLQDLCDFIDYSTENLINRISPSIKTYLSVEQKSSLNNLLKEIASDNNINKEIKDAINKLQEESSIDKNKLKQSVQIMDSPSPRVTQSSYRQNALAYARKHGYTNGYYGSTNRKNNAPSPYYNFQKDGYGDCANFVSQCLRAGGVTFWTNNNPWYYYSVNNRSSSWAGAKQFKEHWEKRISNRTLIVKDTLSFLQPATPISIYDEHGVIAHTLISTDRHSNGYNFSYAAHSDEGKRTNLLYKLRGKKIIYYKVYW